MGCNLPCATKSQIRSCPRQRFGYRNKDKAILRGGRRAITEPVFRYAAFISYSHADEEAATWLQRAIENYRIPAAFVERERRSRLFGNRIGKVFRDREELSSQSNLAAAIQQALEESAALIVICSPAAARSRYVNEEIRAFKAQGKSERIFTLIVDGEPHAEGKSIGGRRLAADDECFPKALTHTLSPDGEISDAPESYEHIAADIRPGKDDRQSARLKLVAGLLGVGLDDLIQRERVAERRRVRIALGAAGVFASVAALAGYFGWDASRKGAALQVALADAREQRDEARAQRGIAIRERNQAEYQRGIAERQTRVAEEQRKLAELRQQEAIRQRDRATLAQRMEREARVQEAAARQEADRQRDAVLVRSSQALAAKAREEAALGRGSTAFARALEARMTAPAAQIPPEADAALLAALVAPVESLSITRTQAPLTTVHFSGDDHWLLTTAGDGDARVIELDDDPTHYAERAVRFHAPAVTGTLFNDSPGKLDVTLFLPPRSLAGGKTFQAHYDLFETAVSNADEPAITDHSTVIAEGRSRALIRRPDGIVMDIEKTTLSGDVVAVAADRVRAAAPDARRLLDASGGSLSIVDYRTGLVRTALVLPFIADRASFSRDGSKLVLVGQAEGNGFGQIVGAGGEPVAALQFTDGIFRGGTSFVGVAFRDEGDNVVALRDDGRTFVWSASDGRLIDHFEKPEGVSGTATTLSPGGRWALARDGIGGSIWRTERPLTLTSVTADRVDTGQPPEQCRRDEEALCPADRATPLPRGMEWYRFGGDQMASQDGRYRLAQVADDQGRLAVSLVDATGEPAGCARQWTDWQSRRAFVRQDGRMILFVDGGTGSIVDCDGGTADRAIAHGPSRLTGINEAILAAAFLPGDRLATAGTDQQLMIWDARTGALLMESSTSDVIDEIGLSETGHYQGREYRTEEDRKLLALMIPPATAEAPSFHGRRDSARHARRLVRIPGGAMPSARFIDTAFERAGLDKAVDASGLDRLDRDILYMRAESQSIDALLERYPWLPRDAVLRLRQILGIPGP